MHSLKYIVFSTVLVLTVACSSQKQADTTYRQPQPAGAERQMPETEERAARQAEQLTTRLMLDEPTTERVEKIILKYAERNEALRQSSGDRRSKFSAFRENMSAQDREMKQLLTEEQYEAYREIREEQRAQMRERMQGRGGRRGRGR